MGEQEREKLRRMQDWEQNGSKLYQRLAEQRAYQQEVQKQHQKQSCLQWLDLQLQWKEAEKAKKRIEAQQEKEAKDKQLAQLKEEERRQKAQEQERKLLYSQALAYQKNIQELQKQNFGKMTYEEKRINKEDLHHFKEQQPEFTALIPGINNLKSVGAAPLKRTKARETE